MIRKNKSEIEKDKNMKKEKHVEIEREVYGEKCDVNVMKNGKKTGIERELEYKERMGFNELQSDEIKKQIQEIRKKTKESEKEYQKLMQERKVRLESYKNIFVDNSKQEDDSEVIIIFEKNPQTIFNLFSRIHQNYKNTGSIIDSIFTVTNKTIYFPLNLLNRADVYLNNFKNTSNKYGKIDESDGFTSSMLDFLTFNEQMDVGLKYINTIKNNWIECKEGYKYTFANTSFMTEFFTNMDYLLKYGFTFKDEKWFNVTEFKQMRKYFEQGKHFAALVINGNKTMKNKPRVDFNKD